MKETVLFLDLDDTIFQTKRKNSDGIIPATVPKSQGTVSYMTESQSKFFNLFTKSDKIDIIPVTARDVEQYNRTFLSDHPKVNTAVTYFSGLIINDNEIDQYWENYMNKMYRQLDQSFKDMYRFFINHIDENKFKFVNVDNYYLVIKNKNVQSEVFKKENKDVLNIVKEYIDNEQFFIHQNSNNISILPYFLDKKSAVEYLIDKYEPNLTIGAGDSITDLGFMSLCDFKIVPKNTQLDKKIDELCNYHHILS